MYKQFNKLKTSPQLGTPLGNKFGYNLSGFRKIYVDKKQLRIIYKILDKKVIVEIIAIGKRDNIEIYQKAFKRI